MQEAGAHRLYTMQTSEFPGLFFSDIIAFMLKLYRVVITIKSSVKNLENKDWLMTLCREVANLAGLNILSEGFSRFKKQGATAFLVLSQSHLSIHTWPEYNLAHIDILSGKKITEEFLSKIKSRLEKESTLININSSEEMLLPGVKFI